MSVPKRKKTKSSVKQRRQHQFLTETTLAPCPKCGKPRKLHSVCLSCGFYKGKEVINVLAKLERKERKSREKDIKETEKDQKGVKKTQAPEKPMTLEELSKKKF